MLAGSLTSLLALAGQSALFQAGAIILGTFILEDAATVVAALQAQGGAVPTWLALLSLYVGIVLGDMGLYGLGRLSAYSTWLARQLPPHRQAAIKAWVSGRVFQIVLVSRFLPGMRLPTYTTCGFIGANFKQFTLAAIVATACWTSLLFAVSLKLGQVLMDYLGVWRWAGAAGFVVFVILAGRAAASGLQAVRR
jgi:membrane protein DedA with SNARE-associated domain